MLMTRSSEIKYVSVIKEIECQDYYYYENKEVKFYTYVKFPWYLFKEDEKIYVDTLIIPTGFYSSEVDDEYYIKYFSKDWHGFIPNNLSDHKTIKDKKVFYKNRVCVQFYDGKREDIYFDDYNKAVEYTKMFLECGLNVIIEDEPLKTLCKHKNYRQVTDSLTMDIYVECSDCGKDLRGMTI